MSPDGRPSVSIEDEERLLRIQNADKKEDQQRYMAWVAIFFVVCVTFLQLAPFIPLERLETVSAFMNTVVVAMIGVVASFMASAAWGKRNNKE